MGEFEKALDAINDLLGKNPPKNTSTYKAAEYRKSCYEFAVEYARKHHAKDYVLLQRIWEIVLTHLNRNIFLRLPLMEKKWFLPGDLEDFNEDFFHSKKQGNNWDTCKTNGRRCQYRTE